MSVKLNKVQAKGVAHFLNKRNQNVIISTNDDYVGERSNKHIIKIRFEESTVTIHEDGTWIEMQDAVTIPASEIGSGSFA